MAKVESVVTRLLGATAVSAENPIGYELAARWVSDRYQQLASRIRFRHRRQIGTLIVPARIDTGLLTATRGSATVTADADAQAVLTDAIEGRHLRIGVAWYEISDYTSPDITLASVYAEDDITDGTYDIVQRYHTLAARVRWLGRFIHPRRHREVVNRAFSVLDMTIPARTQVSDGPWYWAEVGRSSNDRIRIELYPPSTDTELINYVYWDKPEALGLTDDLPDGITEYALTEGALIDLFRYRMSQEANRGNVEMAALWRNEWRAQSTSWERIILEIGKADRAVDDVSFLLHHLGQAIPGSSEIFNARGEVWNRDVTLPRV